MTLGEKILERLEELNMSQKQLATKINISYSTLNGYVKTNRQPDFETLKNIAHELKVTCDYLLDFNTSNSKNITHSEYLFIENFRSLSENQRELITEQIKIMKKQNIKKG